MKLVKIVPLVLAGLLAGGASVPYFLPDNFLVEKSIELPVKPYSVFPHLNNLAQWERWSAWSQDNDPTISRFYKGPAAGLGAECSWKGDKTDGKVRIVDSKQNELLVFDLLVNNGKLPTQSLIKLEPASSGTRITWTSSAKTSGYFNRIETYLLKQKMEQDFERGLNGLKDMLAPEKSRLSVLMKKSK